MEAGSWQNETELLVDVADHGEDTGLIVADHGEDTGLIVAAKDDYLDSFSTRPGYVNRGLLYQLAHSVGDFNNTFRRIVVAAEQWHLSIPETEAGKTRKQYHPLINRSLMFV
ncbi:hypothetical protein Patl1_22650 [Pistacia atlantica]|uniref:Uncharacterized protein n=1 Tax=Pistacia atlantica TaxID=434234 RepID=A0ACC0ZV91_9ROSI|nr:hypothetical protein Patl1_22650 [Pistacia atlantica]